MSVPKVPWRYQEKSDAYTHIVRSGDRFIFQLSQDTSGEAEATARLIVRAVNAHAGLVKALNELRNEVKGCLGAYDHELRQAMGNTNVAVLHDRMANADTALAAAGVKP